MDFPGDTDSTIAPAPISTADPERMPAWSPDGLRLGFVRTANGHRTLDIYDLTPGIQAITTTIDLGTDPPTPQAQAFQSVWGGLALANLSSAPASSSYAAPAARTRCSASRNRGSRSSAASRSAPRSRSRSGSGDRSQNDETAP
jgi:hypothetical protein